MPGTCCHLTRQGPGAVAAQEESLTPLPCHQGSRAHLGQQWPGQSPPQEKRDRPWRHLERGNRPLGPSYAGTGVSGPGLSGTGPSQSGHDFPTQSEQDATGWWTAGGGRPERWAFRDWGQGLGTGSQLSAAQPSAGSHSLAHSVFHFPAALSPRNPGRGQVPHSRPAGSSAAVKTGSKAQVPSATPSYQTSVCPFLTGHPGQETHRQDPETTEVDDPKKAALEWVAPRKQGCPQPGPLPCTPQVALGRKGPAGLGGP